MKEKLIESGKNILIILLIFTLVLLSVLAIPTSSLSTVPWLSGLLQPVAPLLGLSEAELTYVAQADPLSDAAQPTVISLQTSAGRRTVMWDFAALDEAFAVFSPMMGQAIHAAGNFMQVSEHQICAALSAPSVMFRYKSALPASLLAVWMDSRLDAAITNVDTCILSAEGETLSLYLLGSTGYCAQTRLPATLILPILENYEPDGSRFAFEQQDPLAPLSILPGSVVSVPAYSYQTPSDSRSINALATLLGFNPYAETRYTDDQGTECFNEPGSSLQITTGAHVLFRAETNRFTAPGTELAELVETARQLTSRMLEISGGRGRLYLSAVTKTGDITVCEFDYAVNGIPVKLSKSAGHVIFSGTSVKEVSLRLYSFTATGKQLYPLPVAQAIAVLPAGSPLELVYHPTADGMLDAGWSS